MTKKQVLTQIYPDEIPYIFEEMKKEELKRYTGYYNDIISGMIGMTKDEDGSMKSYVDLIINKIKFLSGDEIPEDEQEEKEPDTSEEIENKLKRFAGTIRRHRTQRGGDK